MGKFQVQRTIEVRCTCVFSGLAGNLIFDPTDFDNMLRFQLDVRRTDITIPA
jgi:hypothetical protein